MAKDLNTSTLCFQILHYVQNDNGCYYSFTTRIDISYKI